MDSEFDEKVLNKTEFTEEWNSVTDKIQFIWDKSGYFFPNNNQFFQVMSGKLGATASLANLMAKHKAGEATLSDWLGAASDITLLVAGYTRNPYLAGLSTALGLTSFLTSEGGQTMAKSLWNTIQKYGIADPETGCWLLPPNDLLMQSFRCLGPSLTNAENTISPIILDLDRDGVETISIGNGVYFDHDGNEFAESTAWVSPDDGLLVLDRNGNGQIDDGSELFGNNTPLDNGKLASNGYSVLQEYDNNQDGVLDENDAIWQQLQVWQDKNSNGKVDEDELLTLEQA